MCGSFVWTAAHSLRRSEMSAFLPPATSVLRLSRRSLTEERRAGVESRRTASCSAARAAGAAVWVTRRERVGSRRAQPRVDMSAAAAASADSSGSEEEKEETFPLLKRFLQQTKSLGKLRIIAQNDASVMEAISPSDKLFYATIPNGTEYANIIDHQLNLDLHLKLSGVGGARFEQGTSRGNVKAPTYIIRILGQDSAVVVLSLFLQWDKSPDDLSEDRIAAWNSMKSTFANSEGVVTFP